MVTELVLLMFIYAFLIIGVFFNGLKNSFEVSGPSLGARIERNISIGRDFKGTDGAVDRWNDPD